MRRRQRIINSLIPILLWIFGPQLSLADTGGSEKAPYPCKENLIEVMFMPESQVRLRGGKPVDLAYTKALEGVEAALEKVQPYTWRRVCDVSEEKLDELHMRGELNTGQAVYNLNNIYRLRISEGHDIWTLCEELQSLPGIINAKPMPLPTPPPSVQPPDYEYLQGYLLPAAATPTGLDINYDIEHLFESFIKKSPKTCIVAETNSKVVGFIIGAIKEWGFGVERSGWIEMIEVDPKFMGSGIGKKLGEALIKNFKDEEINEVYTSIKWDSGDLVAFFKSIGFDKSSFINLEYKTD